MMAAMMSGDEEEKQAAAEPEPGEFLRAQQTVQIRMPSLQIRRLTCASPRPPRPLCASLLLRMTSPFAQGRCKERQDPRQGSRRCKDPEVHQGGQGQHPRCCRERRRRLYR